jgi:TolB-like protein/class 3 adenylate cyclase/Flp pilus assembly protein TadD
MGRSMRETRKIAAILVSDVVGYSRLAGADEERVLARLRTLRSDLIDPTIAVYHGRVVKRVGDGLVIEFRSVVDAVRCAIEVQHAMVERNAGLAPDKRIVFRIGLHLGDVVQEADRDLMGDGVNIAARLEGVCEPGGLCLSSAAYEQVRDRLTETFVDLGDKNLKNIARPVRVYALPATAIAAAKDQLPPTSPRAHFRFGGRRAALIAACLAALIAAGWFGWRAWSPPQVTALTAASDKIGTAPRLSIVVLPFENLSGDPEQQYFADGITDDLTTDLSHLPHSFVIARNTAFTYKGKAADVKQIGRELGVRYVLEGSVRRLGETITVNAQLISAETGAHIWADRFDGERGKLGQLQDEVVSRLANSLGVELVEAEALRAMRERPNNPDALDLTMQGLAILNRQFTEANANEANRYFGRALQIDPQLPMALLGSAEAYTFKAKALRNADQADDIERAEALIGRVLLAEPNNARAHWVKGALLGAKKQFGAAVAEQNAALAADGNFAWAHADLGANQIYMGRAAEAFVELETALRLSPRDPDRSIWENLVCKAHAHLAQWDQAIEWCRKSSATNPSYWFPYVYLAAAYGWKGQDGEAKAAVAELLKLKPGFTVQAWANMKWSDNPTFLREYQGIIEGLRKAGLPEGEATSN